MYLILVLMVVLFLAGSATKVSPGPEDIRAWAARTRREPSQLQGMVSGPWLERTPPAPVRVVVSPPRVNPWVPGNDYRETRLPVGYSAALTEWDLIVREATGRASEAEARRQAGLYPSGMPVALP